MELILVSLNYKKILFTRTWQSELGSYLEFGTKEEVQSIDDYMMRCEKRRNMTKIKKDLNSIL